MQQNRVACVITAALSLYAGVAGAQTPCDSTVGLRQVSYGSLDRPFTGDREGATSRRHEVLAPVGAARRDSAAGSARVRKDGAVPNRAQGSRARGSGTAGIPVRKDSVASVRCPQVYAGGGGSRPIGPVDAKLPPRDTVGGDVIPRPRLPGSVERARGGWWSLPPLLGGLLLGGTALALADRDGGNVADATVLGGTPLTPLAPPAPGTPAAPPNTPASPGAPGAPATPGAPGTSDVPRVVVPPPPPPVVPPADPPAPPEPPVPPVTTTPEPGTLVLAGAGLAALAAAARRRRGR